MRKKWKISDPAASMWNATAQTKSLGPHGPWSLGIEVAEPDRIYAGNGID
jgi:hypothetical protein